MTWYLIQRVGQAAAVVAGVMILTFILLHMEPGSVARAVLGLKATPARVAIFDDTYGLSKPLYEQFVIYIRQLTQGNLGVSYQSAAARCPRSSPSGCRGMPCCSACPPCWP